MVIEIYSRLQDNLVARVTMTARVHLQLTDKEELTVGVEFGARMVSIVDLMWIELDYVHRFILYHLVLHINMALTLILPSVLYKETMMRELATTRHVIIE